MFEQEISLRVIREFYRYSFLGGAFHMTSRLLEMTSSPWARVRETIWVLRVSRGTYEFARRSLWAGRG